MKRLQVAVAAAAFTGMAVALAQEPGDTRRGRAIAEMTCAQCHAVERGRIRSRNGQAPTFESIATAGGMTPMALRVALQTGHREMPNLALSMNDTDDVIAYIESLKYAPPGRQAPAP